MSSTNATKSGLSKAERQAKAREAEEKRSSEMRLIEEALAELKIERLTYMGKHGPLFKGADLKPIEETKVDLLGAKSLRFKHESKDKKAQVGVAFALRPQVDKVLRFSLKVTQEGVLEDAGNRQNPNRVMCLIAGQTIPSAEFTHGIPGVNIMPKEGGNSANILAGRASVHIGGKTTFITLSKKLDPSSSFYVYMIKGIILLVQPSSGFCVEVHSCELTFFLTNLELTVSELGFQEILETEILTPAPTHTIVPCSMDVLPFATFAERDAHLKSVKAASPPGDGVVGGAVCAPSDLLADPPAGGKAEAEVEVEVDA